MSASLELVLSSRNRKKSREIAELLAPWKIAVESIADFPEVGEIDEDGDTFLATATKKAALPARQLGRWVIGEDSGLMVDALGGAPGVWSARFSGPGATDESNNARLLEERRAVPPEKRTAAYACTVVLSDPAGTIRASAVGYCRGVIIGEARGTNGFGYDPYFLVREYGRTFGELSTLVKHQISHRARAFTQFIPQLVTLRDQQG
ncbi:MAG: RdgB/HAM1 family non-canonical purine NTP pyrophosphatase [Planctomycetaceae bacterium]